MKQYVVDAFTDKVFAGNPAAVCVMDKWLDDRTMQRTSPLKTISPKRLLPLRRAVLIICAGSRRAARWSYAVMQRWRLLMSLHAL